MKSLIDFKDWPDIADMILGQLSTVQEAGSLLSRTGWIAGRGRPAEFTCGSYFASSACCDAPVNRFINNSGVQL